LSINVVEKSVRNRSRATSILLTQSLISTVLFRASSRGLANPK